MFPLLYLVDLDRTTNKNLQIQQTIDNNLQLKDIYEHYDVAKDHHHFIPEVQPPLLIGKYEQDINVYVRILEFVLSHHMCYTPVIHLYWCHVVQ